MGYGSAQASFLCYYILRIALNTGESAAPSDVCSPLGIRRKGSKEEKPPTESSRESCDVVFAILDLGLRQAGVGSSKSL